MRRFLLLLLVLVLSSCAHHPQILPATLKGRTEEYVVPPFTQVRAEGLINVSLHTGYKNPKVILHGDPRDLVDVLIEVKDGRLNIKIPKGHPHYGEVTAEVRAHFLNSFTYKGEGTIGGSNIHSSLLDLNIDNSGQTTLGGYIVLRKLKASGGGNIQISGIHTQYLQLNITGKTKVQLAGVINVSKLNLEGDALLSMYWIKAPVLSVCQRGRSFIQLAGVVDRLDVELWDSAHFNGRYLRAKSAFVKTHDRSIADLTATKHQHTLATDASDIYFYKVSQTAADFMAYAGSVLDMRDWNRPDLNDYTRYNSPSSAPGDIPLIAGLSK
ncbi:GIN domain-containing protein [Legionella micdadei]|uniref:Putative auto-transporter adhesin head GIN domain-containing protein n=1 Tax=Legionella micdadei TaxID=451 RepID=A0A098GC42_LEGMI|nr:DUF2807 domain-containing protein [Legionella micdadei]ARG96337.1 hypothetical protein B6N58_00790 [Legionella micdadei]KTD29583.1 hypothetical protein Lmic_0655 [Legionella micdadei]NSL18020.1 DUF2807 domain-containing protein [Legionella micdadei]CEG59535.1 conserved exported protein of unknown function [Legionella micdadei]SCX92897.1 Protein of unknown function [Legionella micdadei]